MEVPRQIAPDGRSYTQQEFAEWYGPHYINWWMRAGEDQAGATEHVQPGEDQPSTAPLDQAGEERESSFNSSDDDVSIDSHGAIDLNESWDREEQLREIRFQLHITLQLLREPIFRAECRQTGYRKPSEHRAGWIWIVRCILCSWRSWRKYVIQRKAERAEKRWPGVIKMIVTIARVVLRER